MSLFRPQYVFYLYVLCIVSKNAVKICETLCLSYTVIITGCCWVTDVVVIHRFSSRGRRQYWPGTVRWCWAVSSSCAGEAGTWWCGRGASRCSGSAETSRPTSAANTKPHNIWTRVCQLIPSVRWCHVCVLPWEGLACFCSFCFSYRREILFLLTDKNKQFRVWHLKEYVHSLWTEWGNTLPFSPYMLLPLNTLATTLPTMQMDNIFSLGPPGLAMKNAIFLFYQLIDGAKSCRKS